jgi:Leucine-rich repeat (LRR) protein
MKAYGRLFMMLLIGLLSCVKDPDAGKHVPPTILGVNADLDGADVVLTCEVSKSGNIGSCGFIFGESGGEMSRYESVPPQNDTFSFRISGLSYGVKYCYSSYVSSGNATLDSEPATLEIDQQFPQIQFDAVSARNSSAAVCEYTVTERFSGSMYVCGICWGTGSNPTIENTSKTVDSAEYGSHRVEITGLETGLTYHFRPYAINGKGTVYGEERTLYIPVIVESPELQNWLVSVWDSNSDGILSVEEAAAATYIDLVSDDVSTLDGIGYFPNLNLLRCTGTSDGNGALREADLSSNPGIATLDLSCNKLTDIDLSRLPVLSDLVLAHNPVQKLNVPDSCSLHSLDISFTGISALDYDRLGSLEELHIGGSGLSIDEAINSLRSLKRLYAGTKMRTSVKVYLLSELELLDCEGSPVTGLDLRYNPALTSLNADGCLLESLDLNLNPAVKILRCMCETLKTLYLLEGQEIDGINKGERRYIPASTEIIYTPRISDTRFARYLTDKFDSDYDSFVSLSEASSVTEINIDNAVYSGIASLYGIQMFTGLQSLQVPGQALTSLDLSGNVNLSLLCCDSNPLTSLNLSANVSLKTLYCQSCPLESLDLSHNSQLEAAYLSHCGLKSLDVSNCPSLRVLDCSDNPSLDRITISRSQSIAITRDASTTIVYRD